MTQSEKHRLPSRSAQVTDNDNVSLLRELRAVVRGDVYGDDVTRGVYATDASLFQIFPRCVVVPVDEDDVQRVIEIAAMRNVPITPRGAATSLSGQTYGPGIVLDVSKHMNQVLEVNVDQQWARVQPGVIRDQLNAQVAQHGLHFAPDPATGSRATIGGMIGNNTCGTRSVVYGKTIDHVLECRVLLSDGTLCDFTACDSPQWQARASGDGVSSREAELYRGVSAIIHEHRDEIKQRYPKVLTNCTKN